MRAPTSCNRQFTAKLGTDLWRPYRVFGVFPWRSDVRALSVTGCFPTVSRLWGPPDVAAQGPIAQQVLVFAETWGPDLAMKAKRIQSSRQFGTKQMVVHPVPGHGIKISLRWVEGVLHIRMGPLALYRLFYVHPGASFRPESALGTRPVEGRGLPQTRRPRLGQLWGPQNLPSSCVHRFRYRHHLPA